MNGSEKIARCRHCGDGIYLDSDGGRHASEAFWRHIRGWQFVECRPGVPAAPVEGSVQEV